MSEEILLDLTGAEPVMLDLQTEQVALDLATGEGVALDLTETVEQIMLDLSTTTEEVTLDAVTEVVAIDFSDATVNLSLTEGETINLEFGDRGPPGPEGPEGPRGPAGPSGATGVFRYPQAAPSAQWTIVHGLGFYPAVTTTDTAGTQVYGDVTYLDDNTVQISFGLAFAGYANLS